MHLAGQGIEFVAPIITAGTPIILTAFAGLAALFRLWLKGYEKRQRDALDAQEERQAEKFETIRHQVQNSHSTNLRDDLDEKFAGLRDSIEATRESVEAARTSAEAARDHAADATREARRANARLDRQGREIGDMKSRLDDHIDGK